MLICIGIALNKLTYSWDSFGEFLTITSTSVLFVVLLFLGAIQMETSTAGIERESLQETYQSSRDMSEFERATITKDIAEFNQKLVVLQYWNKTHLFGWFINDAVDGVEPIN